jgi:hypothetical protein
MNNQSSAILWYWPLSMTTFEHEQIEHALYCATLTLLSYHAYCGVRILMAGCYHATP